MPEYNLGLVSVSFRENSPQEILEAMNRAGLKYIEWGSDVHAPCTDVQRLDEIARMQKEYGIECSSYGTYFRLGETPIDELEAYIEAAKCLDTDILRLWCGTKSGYQYSIQEREELFEECRRAARIAEKHGVTLCMECHKKTFTENCADAAYLMNEVASPSFKMYWQPFQWQTPAQNVANAEKIAPYAEHIHVFNWRDDENGVLKKYPLKDAANEWREYLENFSTPRTLLLEFMPDGRIESLEAEADSLRKIVEK